MDTAQMFGIVDLFMTGAGIYLLFSWYQLQFRNEIREGVLVQQGMAKKCKDIEGYKKYIGPKLLLFALCAIAAGGMGLYSDYVRPINTIFYLSLTVVFFIVLVLFVRYSKKAIEMFF